MSPNSEASGDSPEQGHHNGSIAKLAVGACGVVFGDIGTSPIYAFRETFAGHHPIAPDFLHITGVLSLIFWSMMIVVTFKYVLLLMRADNKGEGGSMALLALITRKSEGQKWTGPIILLGVFATALFYGDSMITPAMSIMSATEGLVYVHPGFKSWILPCAIAILIGLFAIQPRGTSKVGALFGPIMLAYFGMLAALGIFYVLKMPMIILETLNPLNALRFFATDGFLAFIAMGAVVLAVTGAEALYADMGHFGRAPIRFSWLWIVMPALILNYMGQGAMILSMDMEMAQTTIKDPFFLMLPEVARIPMIFLVILATIIASQAVISGAFSLTRQAMQLGFIPRLRIKFTNENEGGQIYIPFVNWALMISVLALVLIFQSSSNLAAAYGIAVTGAMFIDTCLMLVLLTTIWKWPSWKVVPVIALFFIVDAAYLGANLLKVPDGGFFPLIIGGVIFALLTTWSKGRRLMRDAMDRENMPIELFINSTGKSAVRVEGTAVYMAASNSGVPSALLHNLKHNHILHKRIIILTVMVADAPHVDKAKRIEISELGKGFYRVIAHYGFSDSINVPRALADACIPGGAYQVMQTSYFLSRQTLLRAKKPGMSYWRSRLFAWMLRFSANAMEFFHLPSNRVVELGSQLRI